MSNYAAIVNLIIDTVNTDDNEGSANLPVRVILAAVLGLDADDRRLIERRDYSVTELAALFTWIDRMSSQGMTTLGHLADAAANRVGI